jgi:hypothetical protein
MSAVLHFGIAANIGKLPDLLNVMPVEGKCAGQCMDGVRSTPAPVCSFQRHVRGMARAAPRAAIKCVQWLNAATSRRGIVPNCVGVVQNEPTRNKKSLSCLARSRAN